MRTFKALLNLSLVVKIILAITGNSEKRETPENVMLSVRESLLKRAEDVVHNGGMYSEKKEIKVVNLTQEASQLFDEFSGFLKTFIGAGTFDIEGFEHFQKHLEEHILALASWVKPIIHENKVLDRQLRFSQQMFRAMKQAADGLKFFNLQGQDQHMVRCMIRINLRLLCLHNSHGDPDISMKQYTAKVKRINDFINRGREIFQKLDDVPLIVKIMFNNYYSRAEKTLQVMKASNSIS